MLAGVLLLISQGAVADSATDTDRHTTKTPAQPCTAKNSPFKDVMLDLYDGFFGTGTGSFFIFLFVRVLGFDFLHAVASAKVLNMTTNLAALALFGWAGHVWWQFMIPMAVANVVGSHFGARLAVSRGSGFIRLVFIVVVAALILKSVTTG